MSPVLTLVTAAVLAATAGPRLLRSSTVRRFAPGVQMAMWLTSMLSVAGFGLLAVAVALWPQHAPVAGLLDAALGCVAALAHAVSPWVDEATGLAVMLGLVGVLTRTVWVTQTNLRTGARATRRHTDLLHLVGLSERRAGALWLQHPTPMAYSVGGDPGLVVATTGLTEHLDPTELSAVLAHERAHLAGRHHRIVSLTSALARALPGVPLFAQAPAATATLVELCADRAAVQATDAASVRSALITVAAFASPTPAGALALAATDLELRLEQLRCPVTVRHGSATASAAGAALTIAWPVLLGAAAMWLVTWACALL